MSRPRRHLPRPGAFPPPLDVFNVEDWWVTDPEDELEEKYARIRWSVARRAYEEGDDWESHLLPPAWWDSRNASPALPSVTRPRTEPRVNNPPRDRIVGRVIRNH